MAYMKNSKRRFRQILASFMAFFLFTKAILEGRPIDIFNKGQMVRDFTYVDDIVESVVRVIDRAPEGVAATTDTAVKSASTLLDTPAASTAPFRLYNIGNSQPVKLERFIDAIEHSVGRPAVRQYRPMRAGDVVATQADVSALAAHVDYRPKISVDEGVQRFVEWYREYFQVDASSSS